MSETDTDRWQTELEEKRSEKDAFFGEHPQSPIPPEERSDFAGLEYFDPDLAYRVEATVHLVSDPEADPVRMETTSGREMRYLRIATLEFDLERDSEDLADGTFELAGYRQEGNSEPTLFVPFRDKTTGQQSYQGGRYMELAAEDSFTDGQSLVLDFNLAYSPFCAYSKTYDCPLPPEENWLEVAIAAGERFESS